MLPSPQKAATAAKMEATAALLQTQVARRDVFFVGAVVLVAAIVLLGDQS